MNKKFKFNENIIVLSSSNDINEWVFLREVNITNCFFMIFHYLVRRFTTHVHVEPYNFFIVGT